MGVMLAQIVVAAVLGAIVGLEREFGAQPAGLRTHMLVSLGATLFTIAGTHVAGSDPTRIAAQVVTGIGFLGGGAILRGGVTVRGLTTAGSLWVTAAIGLAVGLRYWLAALVATVLAVGVLWLVKFAERDWLQYRRNIEVVLVLRPDAALDEVEQAALRKLPHGTVRGIDYAGRDQSMSFAGRTTAAISLPSLAEQLRRLPGVQGVTINR